MANIGAVNGRQAKLTRGFLFIAMAILAEAHTAETAVIVILLILTQKDGSEAGECG